MSVCLRTEFLLGIIGQSKLEHEAMFNGCIAYLPRPIIAFQNFR